MMAANSQLSGFANLHFVLINGDYWNSSKNRRYVQAHAWLVEFANILREWITTYNRNPVIQHQILNEPQLNKHGPLEIIKFVENNSQFIAHNDPNKQFQLARHMEKIRRLRNDITHNNIQNSLPLEELLGEMKTVCGQYSPEGAVRQRAFSSRCEQEYNNVSNPDTTISDLY